MAPGVLRERPGVSHSTIIVWLVNLLLSYPHWSGFWIPDLLRARYPVPGSHPASHGPVRVLSAPRYRHPELSNQVSMSLIPID